VSPLGFNEDDLLCAIIEYDEPKPNQEWLLYGDFKVITLARPIIKVIREIIQHDCPDLEFSFSGKLPRKDWNMLVNTLREMECIDKAPLKVGSVYWLIEAVMKYQMG
jgi:hypothetical protein